MSDYPFKNSVFWCNVFPPDVYAALDAMWIPQTFMKQDRQNDVRHGSRYVRFKASLPSYLNISDARGDQCVPPPASTLLLVVGLATGSAVRERPHTASTSTALSAQLAGSLRLRRDAPSSTSAPETLDGVCQVHLHPAIVQSQLALHHSRGASGCMRVRPMCSV
jgi:hypothetical protein